MSKKEDVFKVASLRKDIQEIIGIEEYENVYQSLGLAYHISKRHPECIIYLPFIASIIEEPEYIGINPNETGVSLELVKTFNNSVQIGIKLDAKKDYLYVATLHMITKEKIEYYVERGRLKKFDIGK